MKRAVWLSLVSLAGMFCFAAVGGEGARLFAEESAQQTPFGFHFTPPTQQGVPSLTCSENPWARFAPGSWVRFQKTVVSGCDSDPVRSLTEIKQILKQVNAATYVLERRVAVHTGALQLEREPELIEYNFYDRAVDGVMTSSEGPSENIAVHIKHPETSLLPDVVDFTRVVPCYVQVFHKISGPQREETKVWYSPVIFPHLLKYESRVYMVAEKSGEEDTLVRSASSEIWINSLDFRFGMVKDWVTVLTERDASERVCLQVTTLHSSQIPGGILSETAIEYGTDGKQLLRSVSRLLDYYAPPK